MNERIGFRLEMTLEQCNRDRLNDADNVEVLVRRICDKLSVTVRKIIREAFVPQGVSVVAILSESHCAVHTWPEKRFATVDIFTCGKENPSRIIPDILAYFMSSECKVKQSTESIARKVNAGNYPGFPEYVIRDTPNGHFPIPRFRRGIGREYLLDAEGIAWQNFFSSQEYIPPEGKDILLLHPCTWAKPYDMSYFITKLREVTDKHERIHRVIISNVGLVPYEYQMNEYFCSYDYNDVNKEYSEIEKKQMSDMFYKVTEERLNNYIHCHRKHYRAMILLGHPVKQSCHEIIRKIGIENSIPGCTVPTVKVYKSAIQNLCTQDFDEPLFKKIVLEELDKTIDLLERSIR